MVKIVLWGCLLPEISKLEEVGSVTVDVDIKIGGIACTQLAPGWKKHKNIKVHMPIMFINIGDCSGIWIVFKDEKEVLELATRIFNEVRKMSTEPYYTNKWHRRLYEKAKKRGVLTNPDDYRVLVGEWMK